MMMPFLPVFRPWYGTLMLVSWLRLDGTFSPTILLRLVRRCSPPPLGLLRNLLLHLRWNPPSFLTSPLLNSAFASRLAARFLLLGFRPLLFSFRKPLWRLFMPSQSGPLYPSFFLGPKNLCRLLSLVIDANPAVEDDSPLPVPYDPPRRQSPSPIRTVGISPFGLALFVGRLYLILSYFKV